MEVGQKSFKGRGFRAMRILIHDYAGHAFPISLSRELAARGSTVTHAFASHLLTPRGNLNRREDDPIRLDFVDVPMAPEYRENKYSFVRRFGYERDYGRKLVRLVKRLRPDVVLSGQTPSYPQLALIRSASSLGIPVITWVQDIYSSAVKRLVRKKFPIIGAVAGAWYRHLDYRCFRLSAKLIAITDDFLPVFDAAGVSARNVTVIPNWAPLEDIPVLPKANTWAAARGLVDKFVFLYSGTLALKHNPEALCELAVKFQCDPAVRVVVVSEGPGAMWLDAQRRLRKIRNLDLFPFQTFDAIPQVLASADVLVAILDDDAGTFSVPSKVLTYHAAGRPILGAIPTGNSAAKMILVKKSGICVSPSDTIGFLSAAVRFRQDSVERLEMGRNARVCAEKDFNIGAIVDRFESVFDESVVHDIDP